MGKFRLRPPMRIALFYALLAGLWLLLSDRAVAALRVDPRLLDLLQTCKGWGFVAVMAGLLYLECKRAEENSRRDNRTLRLLNECNRVLACAVEKSDPLQEVCQLIVQAGGYRLAWLGFAEQSASKTVYPMAQAGYEANYLDAMAISWTDAEPSRNPIGAAIQTGRPCVLRNIQTDPACISLRAEAVRYGYAAEIALPLIVPDPSQDDPAPPLGVLNIYSEKPMAFGAEETELLMELANDVAHGITMLDARAARRRAEERIEKLNGKLELRARELAAVNKASRAITFTLNLEEVFKLTLREVQDSLGVEGVSVLLYDPTYDELVLAAATGPGSEELRGTRRPAAVGIAGEVMLKGQSVLVSDAWNSVRFYNRVDTLTGLRTRSLLAAPLIIKGAVSGVVEAVNKIKGVPTEHDVEMLEALAGAAAIAIENARLYQAEQEQREWAETQRQVGEALAGALDMYVVLDRLLELISRVVANDAANIMLVFGDHARIARWRGYDRFDADTSITTFAYSLADIATLQRMVRTGEPVVVPNTCASPNWACLPTTEWVRSHAAAPLRVRNQVIGFINADSATPDFYGQSHAQRLRTLANQASIALENTRLFSSLDRERERLERLYRLSRKIAKSLGVHQVAQSALGEICAVAGASRGGVLMNDSASAADGMVL